MKLVELLICVYYRQSCFLDPNGYTAQDSLTIEEFLQLTCDLVEVQVCHHG